MPRLVAGLIRIASACLISSSNAFLSAMSFLNSFGDVFLGKILTEIRSLLILIIMAWFFIYSSIADITQELTYLVDNINENIEKNEWDIAMNNFLVIQKKWHEVRDTWTIFLDHHEIDNIDLAMARANKYIRVKDTALSLGEMEVLKKLFDIVKENEALTLTNVL